MTTYLKHREQQLFRKLCEIIRLLKIDTPLIFDVGANKGQSLTHFRQEFPESEIYSFEPNPEMFQELKKNCSGYNNIHLCQIALNNESGIFPFNVTNVQEASSLLKPDPKLMQLSKNNKYDFHTIDVQCETLDYFCKQNNITGVDLLKVDVQGAELRVLEGSRGLLQEGVVKVIYAEMNFAETYYNQVQFEDLLIYCRQFNYFLWDISPFLYTRTGRLWYANTILLHQNLIHQIEDIFAHV